MRTLPAELVKTLQRVRELETIAHETSGLRAHHRATSAVLLAAC